MHVQKKVRFGSLKSTYQLTVYTQLVVFIYDSEATDKHESQKGKQLEVAISWNMKNTAIHWLFSRIFVILHITQIEISCSSYFNYSTY